MMRCQHGERWIVASNVSATWSTLASASVSSRNRDVYIVFVLTETFKTLESTPEMGVVGLDTHDELNSHREADKTLQGRVFGAYD